MNQAFWYERPGAARDRPCLFLDRDGVIVEEVNYLHRPEDVHVLQGVADLVAAARDNGFAVGIVTNQAGIARGYYDWTAFELVQKAIVEALGCGDEPFDFVAGCGAHPDGVISPLRVAGHSWRKPMPGMLTTAAACLGLDLADSIMVGDQLSDVQAAEAAGVRRIFHVRTGHGERQRAAVAPYRPREPAVLELVDDLRGVCTLLGWRDRM